MPENLFIGRVAALDTLQRFLGRAAAGQSQIVFVAGEAGSGKSTLLREFVRRAEEADPHLIAAVGECNAQAGTGDPYLPFRQVLTALTAAQDENQTTNTLTDRNAARLKDFIRVSGNTLMDVGPDLIGIFVPGAALLAKVAGRAATHSRVFEQMTERMGKSEGSATAGLSNPKLDQQQIFQQYSDVLRSLAREQTILLILDDLQWCDSASLALLFHLARQIKDSRLLIVGTLRPDDVGLGRGGERHPLESIVNELKRYNGDIVIDLAETNSNEGRAFVDALVDSEANCLDVAFRDELYRRTDGHPLFTIELLRHLEESADLVRDSSGCWVASASLDWDALPARVEGVIEERIARLPAELHETLAVASIMGVRFCAEVVAQIEHTGEWELIKQLSRELEKRYRLVQEEGERKIGKQTQSVFRFSHALFQQFLYNDLGPGERRLLHRDVAIALEAMYEGYSDENAPELAHHFELARDDEKAIAYLIRAGDAAFRIYAQKEAVDYYTRALQLGKRADISIEQLAHVYTRRGRALELSSQNDLALRNYDEMASLARQLHSQHMELSAQLASATLYSTPTSVRNEEEGERLSHECVTLARQLGDRPAEARALWNLLLLNMYLKANPQQAIAYGEESLAIARQSTLPEQVALTTADLAYAYYLAGRLDEATQLFEQAGSLWHALGDLPMLASTLNRSLMPLLARGQYDQMLSVSAETLRISRSINNRWNQAAPLLLQVYMWLDLAQPAKAIAGVEEAIRLAEDVKGAFQVAIGNASLLWLRTSLGGAESGMELYKRLHIPIETIPPSPFRRWTLALFALSEIALGLLDTAQDTLKQDAAGSLYDPASPSFTLFHLAEGQLAFAQGNATQAVALTDSLIEHMHAFGMRPFLSDALLLNARARLETGERDAAREKLDQALIEADSLGSLRSRWQILAALAEIEPNLDAAGRLRTEAHDIVLKIADHIGDDALRTSFLQTEAVRQVMR